MAASKLDSSHFPTFTWSYFLHPIILFPRYLLPHGLRASIIGKHLTGCKFASAVIPQLVRLNDADPSAVILGARFCAIRGSIHQQMPLSWGVARTLEMAVAQPIC